jgi:hypothetical protein
LTNAKIQLRNPRLPDLEPVEIDALADTGAVHFCIPPHLQIQLELEEIDKKEITYHPHSGWFEVAPRGGEKR